MWQKAAGFILRYRIFLMGAILVITGFMAYEAQFVSLSYKFGGILPEDDSTKIEYDRFTEHFGDDGNVMVLGIQTDSIFDYPFFSKWYTLGNDLRKIDGVDSIFSQAHLYTIKKDPVAKKFNFVPVVNRRPQSQSEVDSLKKQIQSLPFYRGLLFNDTTNSGLMVLTVNAAKFNSEERIEVVHEIEALTNQFTTDTGVKIHISGLPYIRTLQTIKIKHELALFVGLSALVTSLLMLILFKNFRAMVISIVVVVIGVIWSLGTISLFDYKLSILMGLIPPLLIVTGVPNCVFLINQYQTEYHKHGNKIKALNRIISKVGAAIFMINATTALGFATFIFTSSSMVSEFGIISTLNLMCLFVISIIVIPGIFSFLSPPHPKHLEHVEQSWVKGTVNLILRIVTNHRNLAYVVTAVVVIISVYGITKITATGNIVDDLPQDGPIINDLMFFEENFSGVMPLEILVNSKDSSRITSPKNLRKIEKLQKTLASFPEISRPLAITDAVKFAKQAYYNGNPLKYSLPKGYERSFIGDYIRGNQGETEGVTSLFLDSTRTTTRISARIADIGTNQLDSVMRNLKPEVYAIFPKDEYKVTLTGTSIVFLNGTVYLVNNLYSSIAFAIIVIGLLMALLFNSLRMVLISMVPNLVPMIFTAGLMGFLEIPLKPSTILVFSIAFGITVDNTIHFLSRYRQEIKLKSWDMHGNIMRTIHESVISMLYTSIILFFGFLCFTASEFGGTIALGFLTSMTLLVAMVCNLVLLPAMLMSFHKRLITKAFKEPLLEIIYEEEDIELDALEIKQKDKGELQMEH